jgi:hypothetical protein
MLPAGIFAQGGGEVMSLFEKMPGKFLPPDFPKAEGRKAGAKEVENGGLTFNYTVGKVTYSGSAAVYTNPEGKGPLLAVRYLRKGETERTETLFLKYNPGMDHWGKMMPAQLYNPDSVGGHMVHPIPRNSKWMEVPKGSLNWTGYRFWFLPE